MRNAQTETRLGSVAHEEVKDCRDTSIYSTIGSRYRRGKANGSFTAFIFIAAFLPQE